MTQKRTVYYVSESTGITAETLGHSLISQFEQTIEFKTVYMPFINTVEKAKKLTNQFNMVAKADGARPIVFATMVEYEIRVILKRSNCLYIELFDTFIAPLSRELGVNPSGKTGLSHGMANGDSYEDRMDIINFAMVNDDGARLDKYDQADVILIGVSRSGKTPTCLYLAMHFGIKAANYPLTPDDFELNKIPDHLLKNKEKLVALTIDPPRLSRIREERRPGSDYASLKRCASEVRQALQMFKKHNIWVLDTTTHSIEEVSSRIVKAVRSR
ncbi:posphoenolpyruvate synthetase regulatory kinase/phosphorylase PpsR [Sedimenticola selenatireducens]|jgi:regulator of PEP synthase PpsR (kinase-PPPase family)|uniref:Putative phosphoenolpyruvate synthase regulatory protein n=1 Tax=Sedimenticola selenatireducens TaxID=191960 RepID=A0A557S7Z5_9GAMM|nr:pyruvate, water dikinase regulatory protein [Sedimenticola selenatireducens]TVO73530.1 kinase/pyrophosphorylase [Sedimenticola selenatireducens]TVT63471.1 MAG: kinase/pyrophosphorylase [Sedimenticola selenatireducens]